MWERSYSKKFVGVKKETVWKLWTDPNQWHKWNHEIETCTMTEPFIVGNSFVLKAQKAPAVTIVVTQIEQGVSFTDCTLFIGAKMYGYHSIKQESNSITLTVTMSVTGILGFLWRKIVAEKLVKELPKSLEDFIKVCRDYEKAS